jgi:xanthine dehydrogenase accessory factor
VTAVTGVFVDAARALAAGRGVAIATVVGATGSTPRHLAARMAVADDGAQWGTVGGGRIEERAVAAAREVAAGAAPRVVHHHLVQDLAMCCGGAMTIAVTPGAPSRGVIERLAGLDGVVAAAVLETPVDGGPLSLRDVGTGDSREPRVVGDRLVEIVGAVERAVVFGLGHVGRAVGPLLASLGFAVIACDDDETGALSAGAPTWATRVVESFDAAEVERALGGLGRGDYVLVVTRDHAVDQRLLETLVARDDLAYLGMIGSRGKVARFKKRLEARGLLDGELGAARWARLHAPIGVNIGAETPEEIAVAIAAELVAVRRRAAGPAR